MKKFFSLLAVVAMLVCGVFALTACEEPAHEHVFVEGVCECGEEDPNYVEKVTIGWYYGSKLLREEEVEKGTILESWTPVEEGKTFTGWFSEASATTPFDFTVAVEADTDIFAAFKSDEFVNDGNEYYLIGTGAADMGQSSWDHTNSAANLSMEKQDVENANVYKIQIKMYAGDAFQIAYGGSWDGQQGIGIMVGAEYCDGTNKYDATEYTAADKKVAHVLDAEGNVVFMGYDEYNKGFEVWNIFLAEGQDGIYEFTLTTYPNAKAYNTLEWRLVEKVEALSSTHQMQFIGAFNEWKTDENAEIALKESDDKSTWTGYITFTSDMYVDYGQEDKQTTAFKVYNVIDGQYYPGENIFVAEGSYAVQYIVATNEVKVEKLEYYVVGTLIDAEGKAVNYGVKEGVSPKLVAQEDGSYAVDFEAYDATGLGDYSWMKDQNKVDANGQPAVMSIKVVYGSSLGIKDWYSAEGGDNWYLSAGNYSVVLNEGAVTITAK